MTTLSKTDAEALIDRLADKSLTFGCRFKEKKGCDGAFAVWQIAKIEDHSADTTLYLVDTKFASNSIVEQHTILLEDYDNIGHPILIGDVLEKAWQNEGFGCLEMARLAELWGPIGFSKSLQSIFEEAEWECICSMESVGHSPACQMTPYGKVWPKQPHIRELFQLLLQLEL